MLAVAKYTVRGGSVGGTVRTSAKRPVAEQNRGSHQAHANGSGGSSSSDTKADASYDAHNHTGGSDNASGANYTADGAYTDFGTDDDDTYTAYTREGNAAGSTYTTSYTDSLPGDYDGEQARRAPYAGQHTDDSIAAHSDMPRGDHRAGGNHSLSHVPGHVHEGAHGHSQQNAQRSPAKAMAGGSTYRAPGPAAPPPQPTQSQSRPLAPRTAAAATPAPAPGGQSRIPKRHTERGVRAMAIDDSGNVRTRPTKITPRAILAESMERAAHGRAWGEIIPRRGDLPPLDRTLVRNFVQFGVNGAAQPSESASKGKGKTGGHTGRVTASQAAPGTTSSFSPPKKGGQRQQQQQQQQGAPTGRGLGRGVGVQKAARGAGGRSRGGGGGGADRGASVAADVGRRPAAPHTHAPPHGARTSGAKGTPVRSPQPQASRWQHGKAPNAAAGESPGGRGRAAGGTASTNARGRGRASGPAVRRPSHSGVLIVK